MKPVLRPGASLLRRDAEHLQIGTAPGAAYVLREQPGMVPLLRSIDGVRGVPELRDPVDEALPSNPTALIEALRAAHVVLDADAWLNQPNAALRAEARHLAACGVDAGTIAGWLKRRASARVEISFDAETRELAKRVADVLAESGVNASLSPVQDPTLVVVLSLGPCPRDALEVLACSGIAHLPVSYDEDRIRIGPLVRPGLTPCVACDDHQRTLWDHAWPVLLKQLAHPLARRIAGMPHALSAVAVSAAATTIAGESLATCDGREARCEGTVLTVGPGLYDLQVQPVPFADACGCQILGPTAPDLPAAASASTTAVAPARLRRAGTMEA